MAPETQSSPETVESLAARLGIDVAADLVGTEWLVEVNAETSQYIGEADKGYHFWQLDYRETDGALAASRMVAEIPPGGQTEAAYRLDPAESNHMQLLDIHKGAGRIVQAWADNGLVALPHLNAETMACYPLPNKAFYIIRSNPESKTPLVVSSLYLGEVDWSQEEVELQSGETSVTLLDESQVSVPYNFRPEVSRK